jgi:hypothetical protein
VAVKTVNLKRSSFDPTPCCTAPPGRPPARTRCEIEVLATPGHRLVAIDEIVVTK